MNATIDIITTSELQLAGIAHTGIDGMEQTFERVMQWAKTKGLPTGADMKMGRLFYDSFKNTAPDNVRMFVFMITDTPFDIEGEISKVTIPASKCIVGRFEIAPNDFGQSWSELYQWMSKNGHTKAAAHPYEIYHNDYRTHPEFKFVVDLCIPIEWANV